MRCLNDVEIQAAADLEAPEAHRAHIAECDGCRDRVAERRRHMAELTALIDTAGEMPRAADARLRQAITSGRPGRGSTSLRHPDSTPAWRRAGWASALAAVAGVALVVFVILPRFGGVPTTLSASQILGRSLETLSSVRGIELVEYELTLSGLTSTSSRIEQVVDRDHPDRYRIMTYDADGVLESALSQDPTLGRRTHLMRVDGRNYIVNVNGTGRRLLSLPELARAQVEAVITMMQATSDQKLTIQDLPEGRRYTIEMPPVIATGTAATHDLYHARAVIDGEDFRIIEFEASGTMLKEPYSVSFKLIRQVRGKDITEGGKPVAFAIQPGPGDIVLEGHASDEPLSDVMSIVLRELGRAKGR